MWFKAKQKNNLPNNSYYKINLRILFTNKEEYNISTTSKLVNQQTKLLEPREYKRLYLWWMTRQTDIFAFDTTDTILLLNRNQISTIEINRTKS